MASVKVVIMFIIIGVKSQSSPSLGNGPDAKSDEFLEKFQTAFNPPPPFLEIILQFFYDIYGCIYMRGDMMAR